MSRLHVKKGDLVEILTGKDRGVEAIIINLDVKNNRVKVAGVNMCTHYRKNEKKEENFQGIFKQEGWIHASNVRCVKKEKENVR